MQREKLRAVFCMRLTRMFRRARTAKMVCRLSSAIKLKSLGRMERRVWLFLKIYRGVRGCMVSYGPTTDPGASGSRKDLM